MFQFLQTIRLLAAAGIVLPIAIHLWNRKKGKTLQIGSVQLLAETARQQARSLLLKDWLLLLLRCAILLLLAALLAKPVWQKQLTTKGQKGWVLLDPQHSKAYQQYKKQIDSLLLVGFEAHGFSKGFPALKLDDTASSVLAKDTLPYWVLLKALDEQVPTDLPVYLVTNNQLERFSGTRPEIAMNLHWLTYQPLTDTNTNSLVAARLLATDSIEKTLAHSTASYTTFYKKNVVALTLKNGSKISQQDPDIDNASSAVSIDTATLRIGIFTDAFASDVRYLEAALNAIRQTGDYRMEIEASTDAKRMIDKYDWVFWLSQSEVPARLKTSHLFRYEAGKEMPVYSWLVQPVAERNNAEKISITAKFIRKEKLVDETIWSDGYGAPILSLEKNDQLVYHFYSRFNPAWNGLVWSEKFPEMLFNLVMKKDAESNFFDNITIDAGQLQPEKIQAKDASTKAKFVETTDLSKVFWTIAFLLFAFERIFSLNRKKQAHA